MEQVPSVTPAYRGGGGGHGVGGYETGQKKDEVLGRDEHDDKRDGVAVIASSSLPHAGHVGEEWRRRRHSIDSYSDDDDNPAAKQLSRKIENDLISSSKLENGRWSLAEHDRFLEGLERFGKRKWIRIAQHVGSRTVIQVRSHAQKYFKKLRKEDVLSEEYANNSSPGVFLSQTQRTMSPPSHAVPPPGWSAHSAAQQQQHQHRFHHPLAQQQQQQYHHHRRFQHQQQLGPHQLQPQSMGARTGVLAKAKEEDGDENAGLALLTAAADILDKNRGQEKRQKVPADDEEKTVNLDRDETSSAANSDDLCHHQPLRQDQHLLVKQEQDCSRRRPFPDHVNHERRQRQRQSEATVC